MLQIDHIYEFFYENIFREFGIGFPSGGVIASSFNPTTVRIFNRNIVPRYKMFFYDQEPILPKLAIDYLNYFDNIDSGADVRCIPILVTSEKSAELNSILQQRQYFDLYYFFHGFAALDWYRGHYALNFQKPVVSNYDRDYITFNRIINHDRSYRIYFVSELVKNNLLHHGFVSCAVANDQNNDYRMEIADQQTKLSSHAIRHINEYLPKIKLPLVIDGESIAGSSSADVIRTVRDHINDIASVDSFWNVVTETVFYYDKLHLTEKIFKPIVSKQPFMLLAAPGNLEYLRSYGFKTFGSVIDESYDTETDPDLRIQKVVAQLKWYCNLSPQEKTRVQQELEPIIEHNFNHFYGEFKHIITTELLTNCQTLFKEIGYDDKAIAYKDLYRVLTS